MHYRSVEDLNRDIITNLHLLPSDIDVVVGIPRSGLLAANLISLALNLPIAEIDGFAEGRLIKAGSTRRRPELDITFADVRHALIVDDSIHTGSALNEARQQLQHLNERMKLTYVVVYKHHETIDSDVIALATAPLPRIFEWNLFHHRIMREACVDIDGVLCHDPTPDENDDSKNYLQFLLNATPRCLPTQRIGHLVTSRLEKYREQTEAWLAQHDVAYDQLIMLDLPDAETRRRLGSHARFKGEYYRRTNSPLFIESEQAQALEIARISGKDVLCTADQKIYRPDSISPLRVIQSVRQANLRRLVRRFVAPSVRRRLARLLK